MEALRKQLSEEPDDWVPLGRKNDTKKKPEKPSWKESDIINISSTESSPAFHLPRQSHNSSRASSSSSSNCTARTSSNLNSTDPIDISDDDDSDGVSALKHKSKPKPKRLVWSDDEDEAGVDMPQERPAIPIQPLSMPAAQHEAVQPLPDIFTKASTDRSSVANNALQMPIPEPYVFTNPPTAIKLPSNPPRSLPPSRQAAPMWETFDEPDEANLYDPVKSAADAEKDLHDLLASSMNDSSVAVNMEDAVVKGFAEDIKLLPHQIVGRIWMKEREQGKKRGGILADDMGLGKTIQTLTRIVDGRPRKADKNSGYSATTLVVCPVALIGQWAKEIARMAVGLRVLEHHGPSRTIKPSKLKEYHVVVTSYSVLQSEHAAFLQTAEDKAVKKKHDSDASDSDDSDPPFGRTVTKKAPSSKSKKVMDALFQVDWWRIVLDEAHNIKNRNTKSAIACCALNGKFRWCLTGTPLQNNVEELFSLLKFLQIRPLNDWETFNRQINKPVKSGRSQRAMKRLHVILSAIMLRRKKDALINGKPLIVLPPRRVEVVTCTFDSEERAFYESISAKVDNELNKFRASDNLARNYTSVLVLLLRLRQACNHPSLISKDYVCDKEAVDPQAAKGKDLDDADDLADAFGQMGVSSEKRCQMCQTSLTPQNSAESSQHCDDCAVLAAKSMRKSLAAGSNLPEHSAKTKKILEILDTIRENDGEEKTIIFSQFTSMLDIIEPFLKSEGYKFVRYDGSMKKEDRDKSLDTIREKKSVKVILISFKAGSTGLNLTACNNVILVDLWWNPALEDQAFDRAHRLGQTRKVNIYKLTIEQTVEERILTLQDKKRELAAAALSGDKLKNSRLGLNELMALFRHDGKDDDDE